jgi:hypothetical protein
MVMPGIQQLTRQAGYDHNLPPKEAIIEKKDYRGAQKLLTARGMARRICAAIELAGGVLIWRCTAM